MTVSEAKAWRMARDAYLKGDEDARLEDEPRDYEVRVMEAEDVARVLLRTLADRPTQEDGADG